MKFTIEVDDFWLEEEDLTEALQARIKNDVVHEISASVKEQTERLITEKIEEIISKKIELVIDSAITDIVATEMITINRKDISIVDHIKNVFQNNNSWSNPTTQIANIAKNFTAELKKQYDMVFANKIVVKMKEQGFLKDDLVQVLLKDNDDN